MREPEDLLWLTVLSGVVFLSWLYHLYRSWGTWREERSYRAFRAFFIAVMMQVALLATTVRAAGRLLPDSPLLGALQAVISPLAIVLLLSGGLVTAITWLRQGSK